MLHPHPSEEGIRKQFQVIDRRPRKGGPTISYNPQGGRGGNSKHAPAPRSRKAKSQGCPPEIRKNTSREMSGSGSNKDDALAREK